MTNTRKMIAIFMTMVIFCSLFAVTFAVDISSEENMSAPPTGNPFEYAKAPDGFDVFIYYGYSPYSSWDIDTSECILNRLYIYNAADDALIMVSEQEITAYTYTQTALYYVTAEQKIYKTDYSGINHEYLYQSVQGNIDNLNSYFDTLYFIENYTSVKLLDVANKTVQELWAYEYLTWVIMLDATQLIVTTADDVDYLYDISANTATPISSIAATNLVTAAVKGTASNNARSTDSIADYSDAVPTQENDVSFPLSSYPAVACGDYSQKFNSVQSWFHKNGLEGCGAGDTNCKSYCGSNECKGFAKYAHDKYAHIYGDTYSDQAWENRICITKFSPPAKAYNTGKLPNGVDKTLPALIFDGNILSIKGFFATLNTGAYIRYGKYQEPLQPNGDSTPEDGCHSIVFIASDDDGIWVYECNQDSACGIFLQYYPYVQLPKYNFVLNYVNHLYTEDLGVDNEGYHIIGCGKLTEDGQPCAAYIRTNSGHYSYYENASKHTVACCSETPTLDNHNGTTRYYQYSETQHMVGIDCCKGGGFENHSYDRAAPAYSNTSYHHLVCDECGHVKALEHDNVTILCDDQGNYQLRFDCCGGSLFDIPNMDREFESVSGTKHRITFSCLDKPSALKNHIFAEDPNYVNATYHKRVCDECGYIELQEHTDIQTVYVNTSRHSAEFRCCDEGNFRTVAHNDVHKVFVNRTSHRTEYRCCNHNSAATAHTGTIVYTSISSSKHSVGYSCCEGSVTEVHMLESIGGGRQECILCGYTSNNLLDVENEEVA